tara:strand:+ start:257 stop:661 length:405 start_codon:yes stop_codon:yes gene_type:complete
MFENQELVGIFKLPFLSALVSFSTGEVGLGCNILLRGVGGIALSILDCVMGVESICFGLLVMLISRIAIGVSLSSSLTIPVKDSLVTWELLQADKIVSRKLNVQKKIINIGRFFITVTQVNIVLIRISPVLYTA